MLCYAVLCRRGDALRSPVCVFLSCLGLGPRQGEVSLQQAELSAANILTLHTTKTIKPSPTPPFGVAVGSSPRLTRFLPTPVSHTHPPFKPTSVPENPPTPTSLTLVAFWPLSSGSSGSASLPCAACRLAAKEAPCRTHAAIHPVFP